MRAVDDLPGEEEKEKRFTLPGFPWKYEAKREVESQKSAVYRNHDIGNPLLDGYSLSIAYQNFLS